MRSIDALIRHLDQTFPDSQIVEDISRLLREGGNGEAAIIELGGNKMYVPYNVSLKVVTKALFKDDYNSDFGAFRAQVAVGSITSSENGIVISQFCFATLYYNKDCKLITADFHTDFR